MGGAIRKEHIYESPTFDEMFAREISATYTRISITVTVFRGMEFFAHIFVLNNQTRDDDDGGFR